MVHPTLSQMLTLLATPPAAVPEAPFAPEMLIYVDGTLEQATDRYQGGIHRGVTTVQEAIDLIPTWGTIRVRAGTYRGTPEDTAVSFNIMRPMTLEGAPGELPTLKYPANYDPHLYPILVSLEGHGITFRNFELIGTQQVAQGDRSRANLTIRARGHHGTQGASPVYIQQLVVRETGMSGILIDGARFPTFVERNRITGGGFSALEHGIYIAESDGVIVRHNDISGMSGYGIHCYDPSGIYPSNCKLHANHSHHNAIGGLLLGGTDHEVLNNTFMDNGVCQSQTWRNCTGMTLENNLFWHTDVIPQRGDWCKELPDNPDDYVVQNNNIGSIQDAEGVWTPVLRANNLNVEPKFAENAGLSGDSPMIGAGKLVAGVRLLNPAESLFPQVSAIPGNTTIGAYSA